MDLAHQSQGIPRPRLEWRDFEHKHRIVLGKEDFPPKHSKDAHAIVVPFKVSGNGPAPCHRHLAGTATTSIFPKTPIVLPCSLERNE